MFHKKITTAAAICTSSLHFHVSVLLFRFALPHPQQKLLTVSHTPVPNTVHMTDFTLPVYLTILTPYYSNAIHIITTTLVPAQYTHLVMIPSYCHTVYTTISHCMFAVEHRVLISLIAPLRPMAEHVCSE